MTWRLFLTYLRWLFFSFEDRLARMGFWLGGIVAAPMFPPFLLFRGYYLPMPTSPGGWLFFIAESAFALIAGAAISAKRAHDRAKTAGYGVGIFAACNAAEAGGAWIAGAWPDSAWNWVVQIAAIALCVWYLVEFGFLRGTNGPNVYGDDPRKEEPLKSP